MCFVFQLKGCNRAHVCQEVDVLLQSLPLEHVRKSMIDTLSGGTKRCLQLALALIGDTKVWISAQTTFVNSYVNWHTCDDDDNRNSSLR